MKTTKDLIKYLKVYNIIPVIICFLLGRIRIFGFFSPLAFSASACFGTGLSAILGAVSFLGILSKGINIYIWKYLFIYAAFLLINPIVSKKLPEKDYSVGVAPALSVFIGGSSYAVFYGFSPYYFAVNIIEAFFSFFAAYIFDRGFGIISPYRKVKAVDSEEIISIILISGGVICGLMDTKLLGIDLSAYAISVFLLMASYKFGSAAGASLGVMIAFIYSLQTQSGAELFAVLSLAGIFSGFVRGRSRGLCGGIFISTVFLAALYFDKELIKPDIAIGAVLGATTFLFMPDRLYYRLTSLAMGIREPEEYIAQAYAKIENTLKSYSFSFRSLSTAFTSLKEDNIKEDDVCNRLTDEIGELMCSDCSLKSYCWDKNFCVTTQAIYTMIMCLDCEGYIDISKISNEFKYSCMAFSTFVQNMEKIWERERIIGMWQNKYNKTGSVMKCYLEIVSELLFGLSQSFKTDLSYDDELSLKLSERLREESLPIKNLSAGKTTGGRPEILVTLKSSDCTKHNTDKIIETLNSVMTKKIMKESGIVVMNKNKKDLVTLRLIGENNFHVGVKILREPKKGESVSGDSHTLSRLKDGTYLLALSDGMGSGSAASEESAASLDLFRDFISSGFSKQASVKLINTCLEWGRESDFFATLDVCIIDLYSGEASFIKTGACPSYILRNDRVEIIEADALPVGIVDEIEPQIIDYQFKKNDTLIMVTDGVTDSFGKLKDPSGAFIKLIEDNSELSYPKLCEAIFERVKKNYRGRNSDDITVMVARIY